MVNGVAYDWEDISVVVLGRTVAGISAVKFSSKQEKVNNYGAGSEPISRGRGKVEYETSITLELKEVIALIKAAQDQIGKHASLRHIPRFPVTVQWVDDENETFTVTLEDCEFMDITIDTKSGDTTIEVELPLIISGITYE